MSIGPVELLVLKFPDGSTDGRIGRRLSASLGDLVEAGTIRVIDVLFAHKSRDGRLDVTELHELEDEEYATLERVIADVAGLINRDDVDRLTAAMEPGTSAAVMLFEDAWAKQFADDVDRLTAAMEPGTSAAVMLFEDAWAKQFADDVAAAKGEVVLAERIPRAVIDELLKVRDEELVAAR